jgi:hypothetical protein
VKKTKYTANISDDVIPGGKKAVVPDALLKATVKNVLKIKNKNKPRKQK